jgi:hypothetical protein
MMQSPADGSIIIEETGSRPSGDNSLFLPLKQFFDGPCHMGCWEAP